MKFSFLPTRERILACSLGKNLILAMCGFALKMGLLRDEAEVRPLFDETNYLL